VIIALVAGALGFGGTSSAAAGIFQKPVLCFSDPGLDNTGCDLDWIFIDPVLAAALEQIP